MATFDTTNTTGQSIPGGGMTLTALMQRQQELANAQGGIQQQQSPTIAGGLGQMLSAAFTGMRQQAAGQQLGQARQAYSQAFASFDPATGTFKDPNAMATIAMLDPETARSMSANMYEAAQTMARQKEAETAGEAAAVAAHQRLMGEPHTPEQWVEYGAQTGKYGDLSKSENRAKYEADRQAAVSTGIKEAAAASTAQASAQDFSDNVDVINKEIDNGTMTGPSFISAWLGRGTGGTAYRQISAGLDALHSQMVQSGKSPSEIDDAMRRLTPMVTDDAQALHDKVNGIKKELETLSRLPSAPERTPDKTSPKKASPSSNLPTPQTDADYNALPSGAHFIDPDDGQEHVKP